MTRPAVWVRCIVGSLVGGAALGALALMAVPERYRPGGGDAEAAAIAALRDLAEAQRRFAAGHAVDLDGDQRGEFGFLSELAGCARLRIDARGRLGASLQAPSLVPPELSPVATGAADNGDYALQVHVPGPGETWVSECADGGGGGRIVDIERSERTFRIYAWPLAEGRGERAFCIDESGTVRACGNPQRHYEDRDRPVAGDAMDADRDALVWRPILAAQ